MERLAGLLEARYLGGQGLWNKRSATAALSGASLFHYHGHVRFKKGDALKSHLVLSKARGHQSVGDSKVDGDAGFTGGDDGSQLSAEDLFGYKLATGALVTLVECRSGGADVSGADDALCLPMAMHHAGAAAIVSSLWRLNDEDGVAWADAFYGDLLWQRDGPYDSGTDAGGAGAGVGGELRTVVGQAAANQGNVGELDADSKEVAGSAAGRVREPAAPGIEADSMELRAANDEKPEKDELRISTERSDLVNLALAMQTTVHSLRFDSNGCETARYRWAEYLLSESWIFPFVSISDNYL